MTTWWIVFERRKGSKTWTPTVFGYKSDKCVFHSSFEEAANETFDRAAYYEEGKKWEYKIMKMEIPHK